jgi:cytochrome c
MKKHLIPFIVVALFFAFAGAGFAEAYTLTVSSYNPSSGVAVTVSPNDTSGRANGTTQFTRNYNSGTTVTLTAPASPVVSGRTYYFQKWRRNSTDYTTSRTATVTIAGSVTMTAYYITTPPRYTLTVASVNPSSGAAVTVTPNDVNGAGSGSTQFTRTYNSGTSVSLTAASTAGGNTFQKWQKNGVDAGVNAATSVTISANTTMTAVYAPVVSNPDCKNGVLGCSDAACAAEPSCVGASPTHRAINAYDGPSTCIACHTSAGTQVLNSMHGSWIGATPNVPNIAGDSGKWRQTNNYCTDPEQADFACLKCHVSLVAPLNAQGKVDMSKARLTPGDMDCMQCHSTDYRATFMPDQSTATAFISCVDGSTHTYIVPVPAGDGKIHKQIRLDLSPTPGQTAISLARLASRPSIASCVLKCHAKAGGSDGAKRGDLGSAMSNPTFTTDVHLSAAGAAKLLCTSCHSGTGHQIPGRGNDMRGQDTGATMKKCVDCHVGKDTTSGHGTSTSNRQAANRHVAKVDCTACHIDYFGKGTSTELSRDWTKPYWNPAGCEGQGAYNGEEVRGSNVLPEYRFWNGTSWVYDRNGTAGLTTDTVDGGLAMSYPLGDMSTGKLYPFKIHTSKNPISNASGKTNFDVLKMFMTGCYDEAAVSGLNFIAQSGAYTWTDNKAFQLITHGVAPKAEGNNCAKCHSGTIDTSTVSKLDKLGYKTPKPTSDLCNDCHGSESNRDFYSVHNTHRSRGISCSRCHSFSRP